MKGFSFIVLVAFSAVVTLAASGCSGLMPVEEHQAAMAEKDAELVEISGALEICETDKDRLALEATERIAVLETEVREAEMRARRLADERNAIHSELETLLSEEGVTVSGVDDGILVTLQNQILFASGSASLEESALSVMDQLANVLAQHPDRMIRVAGHTDDRPITSANFPSNWELSAARASSVVRRLIGSADLDPNRFIVQGFGEFRPVDSNETAEGRAQNRRVEVYILD